MPSPRHVNTEHVSRILWRAFHHERHAAYWNIHFNDEQRIEWESAFFIRRAFRWIYFHRRFMQGELRALASSEDTRKKTYIWMLTLWRTNWFRLAKPTYTTKGGKEIRDNRLKDMDGRTEERKFSAKSLLVHVRCTCFCYTRPQDTDIPWYSNENGKSSDFLLRRKKTDAVEMLSTQYEETSTKVLVSRRP